MATRISLTLPNGYIGSASQSAAVRNLIASTQKKTAKRSSTRKKASRPSKAKASRRASKRKTTSGTKMRAGSAAAKAWGKKMKKLRNKKK